MLKLMFALFIASVACQAGAFPLSWVQASPKEAFLEPGGSSAFCHTHKPSSLLREAPPVSQNPLYGQLPNGLLFRLDESRGTGRGYDRLCIDANGNGDLSDDSSFKPLKAAAGVDQIAGGSRIFAAPNLSARQSTPGLKPEFYYQAVLYSRSYTPGLRNKADRIAGILWVKAAQRLAGEIVIDGKKLKVEFIDGNCDGKISRRLNYGDLNEVRVDRWDAKPVDYMILSPEAAGKSGRRASGMLILPFNELVSLNGLAYQIHLRAAGDALEILPWAGPTGELRLPGDSQVKALAILRKSPDGGWDWIVANNIRDRVQLPAGDYRWLLCTLESRDAKGRVTRADGRNHELKRAMAILPGKATPLACGLPLRAEIKAVASETYDSRLYTRDQAKFYGQLKKTVWLTAEFRGQGGELYAQVYEGANRRALAALKEPVCELNTATGKRLVSGRMTLGRDGLYHAQWELPRRAIGVRAVVKVDKNFGSLLSGHKSPLSATYDIQL